MDKQQLVSQHVSPSISSKKENPVFSATRRLKQPLVRDWRFRTFCIVMVSAGIVLVILNALGILAGTWLNVVPVIFGGAGLLVNILWPPKSDERGEIPEDASPHAPQPQQTTNILIVKVGSKKLLGTKIHLFRGDQLTRQTPSMTTVVSEQKHERTTCYQATFLGVPLGNYTLMTDGRGCVAFITIKEGHPTEIILQ